MEDLPDEALMLRYGEGDADAFAILYGRHKDGLYRFVRRQCHDPDRARDLVQDIWTKLIAARRRYRAQARFTTYLYTLARNRMIDYYRAQGGEWRTSRLDAGLVAAEGMPDDRQDEPDMRAHTRAVLERSLELIHGLPQAQREAVLLYVEGLSLAEIGEIAQIPAETARSRVRRALAWLRQELEGVAA